MAARATPVAVAPVTALVVAQWRSLPAVRRTKHDPGLHGRLVCGGDCQAPARGRGGSASPRRQREDGLIERSAERFWGQRRVSVRNRREVASLTERHKDENIQLVSFGAEHLELAGFLQDSHSPDSADWQKTVEYYTPPRDGTESLGRSEGWSARGGTPHRRIRQRGCGCHGPAPRRSPHDRGHRCCRRAVRLSAAYRCGI